ncbi:ComEC/Rec2 family competence protein [Kiritimatiellota bacterium B12222]|nr:ComEC/Rec2 family competence protein [Kiritimatiellota bacterium B12222]
MKLSRLAVCMLLAAGLLPVVPAWMMWVGLLGVGGSLVFCSRRLRGWGLAFLVAGLWCQLMSFTGAGDLKRQLTSDAGSVRIRFKVSGDSDLLTFRDGNSEWRVPVKVFELYREGEWISATGRAQLRVAGEQGLDLMTGELWQGEGVLRKGHYSHVGLFRAEWRFSPDPEGLRSLAEREGSFGGSLTRMLFDARATLSNGIQRACPHQPLVVDTLQALLLGMRTELDREVTQGFARTGLLHVFAISGLHLGMLAGMLLWGCKRLGFSPRSYPLVVFPLLFVFCLYTGMRASALRALVMIACLLLAACFNRKPHAGNAFALAIVVILGIAPAQIYDLGFQYSFLLVGSLLACGRLLNVQLEELFAADPWAPVSSGREFRKRYVWPRVQGAVVVSMICFVVAAPLTAYGFHLFSPIGLVGNLLAVPLVFMLLGFGFPALLSVMLPTAVSEICFLPAKWSAEALLAWVAMLEKLPGAWQWVKAPPLWMLCLFYGLLFLWWKWPQRQRGVWAGFLCLAGYAATASWLSFSQPQMRVIDAERGQAVWFRLPGEGVVLVDAGSAWTGRRVTRSLQEAGIDKIDTLILTHPDRNHVGGWEDVFSVYQPKHVWVAEADRAHDLYQDLQPVPGGLEAGDVLTCGGWAVEVFHPPADLAYGAADRRSLLLRISHEWSSVFLMGGAGAAVVGELQGPTFPPARLLLAGLPRSGALLWEDLLLELQPEVVVFSGESYDETPLRRSSAEALVMAQGSTILRTPEGGEIFLNPYTGRLLKDTR